MLRTLKKAALSLSVIVLFALYAVQARTQSTVESTVVAAYVTTVPAGQSSGSPAGRSSGSANPSPSDQPSQSPGKTSSVSSSEPSPSPSSTGAYLDGTYTGTPADAGWGTVEVQALIANGEISDVQFLQHPDHRSRSRTINDRAMPILSQEALQSQRAEVDVVTGATDTSDAFIQSLTSALKQATS